MEDSASIAALSSNGTKARRFECVAIDAIKDNPHPTRKPNRTLRRKLEASYRRFGENAPILVDRLFTVIAGNERLKALKALGRTHVWVADMVRAGESAELALINICVWTKTNASMGSFYRSQNEMIPVFKFGAAPHVNNIQLGRFGKNRSNVWTYAGANVFPRRGQRDPLEYHPTAKPIDLIADAIQDCSNRNDIILDPFVGSGTTVLAAERTGRRCFGIELDPLHVDTAVRRWQRMTKKQARNALGQTFDEVSLLRGTGNGR